MYSSEPFSDPAALDWLGATTLEALPGEVRRRLAEARDAGVEQGYRHGHEDGVKQGFRQGHDMASLETEARLREELKERLSAMEAQFASREIALRQDAEQRAEARMRESFDQERQAWEAQRAEDERLRAESSLKEAEDRGKAFDRTLRDREKAIEERLRRELAAGDARPAAVTPEPTFQRSQREAPVLKTIGEPAKVDVVRKQAFQSGFEQGLTKGRRDAEAEVLSRLNDAKRQGYVEGLSEGRRASLGIEGSRSWALGVMHLPDEAGVDEVRQRFRKLSLLLHPDQNPGLGDTFIKNLNRARDVLGG